MKRIFSALILLALISASLFSTSCGGTDAQTLINDAMVSAKNADAYEANLAITLSMHFEGDEDDVYASEIHVVTKNATSESPEVILQRTLYVLGMPLIILTYTDSGEWGYVVYVDEMYKTPYEDIEKSVDTAEITQLLFKFPPMVFEGAAVIKNSDGSTTVKFDIEKNLFHELYKKLLDSFEARMEVEDSNLIRVSNARAEITIADGKIRDYDLFFDMASDGEQYPRNASVKLELDYLAFGDDVTLTPPEGYLDYPLLEATEEESETEEDDVESAEDETSDAETEATE